MDGVIERLINRSIGASPLLFPAPGQPGLRTGRVASPRDCWERSELAGEAAASLGCAVWCVVLVPLPSLRPAPFLMLLIFFFFSSSSFSFSPPLLFCSFFRLPFYSAFPKSQRDSRWGVVGYDLRAGCDVRRGSQRCVGRGARGAVPGMDWAWSGRSVQYREWMRMGGARRAGGRLGGQVALDDGGKVTLW